MLSRRRAKIVCTIGPSSMSKKIISLLIKNGMDVARLNFSHGDHDTHKKIVELIRDTSQRLKRPVAILQDLQGIKIRVGLIETGSIELKKGSTLLLVPGNGVGNQERIFISYPALLKDIKRGDRIVITSSSPLSTLGKTNFMKLHSIGE